MSCKALCVGGTKETHEKMKLVFEELHYLMF